MPLYTEEQRRKAEIQVRQAVHLRERDDDLGYTSVLMEVAIDTQLALNDAEEQLKQAQRLLIKWMIREDDPADLGEETTAWLRTRGEKGAN